MITANFILPFDPITRQTLLPLDPDGNQYPLDWWHLSMESGNTVLCQVRGDDAVIQEMKDSGDYQWLEDKVPAGDVPLPEPPIIVKGGGQIQPSPVEPAPVEIVKCDPAAVRDWIVSKRVEVQVAEASKGGKIPKPAEIAQISVAVQAEVDELSWEDADTAIESVVSLYDQTLENYRSSGLG